MFSINFYQEFDAHHAAFRLVRLRAAFAKPKPIDVYRILDFLLVFPFELGRINLGPGVRRHRQLAETYAARRPYRYSSRGEQVILQMWPFQQVALHGLARREFLNPEQLSSGFLHWHSEREELPSTLRAHAEHANSQESDLVEFLIGLSDRFPASGEGSLKARSKLLPHNYDVRSDELLHQAS